MGLADARGSILTSTATNNTNEAENAIFDYALPVKYQVGAPVSVIVRTQVSLNRDTAQQVDCEVSLWVPGGGIGGDICTTAIQTITNAYADYVFTVNPATLNPGDLLSIRLIFVGDDGGGGSGAGTITCSQVTVQTGIKQ